MAKLWLYRVGNRCGFLESLVGVEVVSQRYGEAILVEVKHRGIKFLDSPQGRTARIEGRVNRFLGRLETLVIALELRVAQHELQEAATDGQGRAAALSQCAPAEVDLAVLATHP